MDMSKLVEQIEPAHEDERRIIWEPVNERSGLARINFLEFHGATKPGGNHFHKRGWEIFLLVKGRIKKMVLEHSETKERVVFENLSVGTKITIPSLVAHALFFEPGSMMLAGCSEPFDEKDQDLNPYPLLDRNGEEIP